MLRRYGKHHYLWTEARYQWVKKYGEDHQCHYCGIRCTDNETLLEQDMGMRKLTLDHLDARSEAPELRYAEHT